MINEDLFAAAEILNGMADQRLRAPIAYFQMPQPLDLGP